LVAIIQKDGTYLFREAPLASTAGGNFPTITYKEIQESVHIEQIHTHPYGLVIEWKNGGNTEHVISRARYMPPSMVDIGGSIESVGSSSEAESRLSFRVIDPQGDWIYTVDPHHPFFKNFKNYKDAFRVQTEEKQLVLTEEELQAIEENGLTAGIMSETASYGLVEKTHENQLLKEAQRKISAQDTLHKELATRLIPEEVKLMETIQALSIEITSFDNDTWVKEYTSEEKIQRAKEQQDRIMKLCTLYKQMGINMSYTLHEQEK
jgi:hypothetical protein